jgi:hypothetical protein
LISPSVRVNVSHNDCEYVLASPLHKYNDEKIRIKQIEIKASIGIITTGPAANILSDLYLSQARKYDI